MRALQQSDGYVRCKIIKKKVDLINKKEFLRFLLFESIKAFVKIMKMPRNIFFR